MFLLCWHPLPCRYKHHSIILCIWEKMQMNADNGYIQLFILSKLDSGLGTMSQLWSHTGKMQKADTLATISWWRWLWRPPSASPALYRPFCFPQRRLFTCVSATFCLHGTALPHFWENSGLHQSPCWVACCCQPGKGHAISSHASQHHHWRTVLVRYIIMETTLKICIFTCALLYPQYSPILFHLHKMA